MKSNLLAYRQHHTLCFSWVTVNHELAPTNPALFCEPCFFQFNYRGRGGDGDPVCKFKAYPIIKAKLRPAADSQPSDGDGARPQGGGAGMSWAYDVGTEEGSDPAGPQPGCDDGAELMEEVTQDQELPVAAE